MVKIARGLCFAYDTNLIAMATSLEESDQEALLLQRDCATLLSVEILQLQNIPFEN